MLSCLFIHSHCPWISLEEKFNLFSHSQSFQQDQCESTETNTLFDRMNSISTQVPSCATVYPDLCRVDRMNSISTQMLSFATVYPDLCRVWWFKLGFERAPPPPIFFSALLTLKRCRFVPNSQFCVSKKTVCMFCPKFKFSRTIQCNWKTVVGVGRCPPCPAELHVSCCSWQSCGVVQKKKKSLLPH